MKLNFRNMPVGSLPYNDIQSCKKMMLKLFEGLPFLPELPLINSSDNVICRTFSGVPQLTFRDGKFLLPGNLGDNLTKTINLLDKICKSSNLSDYDTFTINAPFMEIFEAMLEKFKPEYAYVNLIGPFSFANMIFNYSADSILTDKICRKYIAQIITCKALWLIYYIKSISPNTKPILMFHEDLLFKFGALKRKNEFITNDTATSLFTQVFQRLKKENVVIGVQSFQKCNWQLIFDTNLVDIISFDAYNNPDSLSILAQSIHKFLAKGGTINWGIVPTMNENVIKTLNFDQLYKNLVNTIENLAQKGVSADLLYQNLTVSVQGDLNKYPILFAEKALIMAEKIAKKLPTTSGSIQQDN